MKRYENVKLSQKDFKETLEEHYKEFQNVSDGVWNVYQVKLFGDILTTIDAILPEGKQNKSVKDIIKTQFQKRWEEMKDYYHPKWATQIDATPSEVPIVK